MNVWTAYLNFENMYGSESRVDEVLRQAQLKVDPVAIQRRLCDIYAHSGKFDVSKKFLSDITGVSGLTRGLPSLRSPKVTRILWWFR